MKSTNIKIIFVGVIALIALFLVSFNVWEVTVNGYHRNSKTDITLYSNKANVKTTIIEAKRGNIYDRNGNVIATDEKRYTLIAVLNKDRPNESNTPAYVDDIDYEAGILSEILNCDKTILKDYLSQDKYQVEFGKYGRNLSLEIKELIESYDLHGIEFKEITVRNYPLGVFASHIVGFAQYDSSNDSIVGKMGIESIYNKQLTGTDGYKKQQVNTAGYTLPGSKIEEVEAKEGNEIYLTIDKGIQEELEHSFQMTIDKWEASKVWGAVMEIETGKVLAYGQCPTFNPNILDIDDYTNFGTQFAYEPGSTMKTFTYAAAIDSGVYDGTATFNSKHFLMGIENNKPIQLSDNTNKTIYGKITNSRNNDYGIITYNRGYKLSSNVGIACLLTHYLDTDVFEEYLDRFGFFEKVGFDGFEELAGSKNMVYPFDKLAAGYGQGISVTMVQLLQAYTAILNDGVMVKPYIVQEIKNPSTNEVVYLAQTEIVGNPIKQSTANQMVDLMYSVVNDEDGTAKAYRTSEVSLIGKTGTAQIANQTGETGYQKDRYITSCALAFPADDPKIFVYYAFESDYNRSLHVYTEPVINVIKKAAINCGLTKAEKHHEEEYVNIEVTTLDNCINHTLDYVYQKNADIDLDYVIIGDGETVLRQYPKEGSIVTTNQKVFLLTSQDNLKMPDLTGCNRKEIMAFWDFVNIAISIKGEGKVVSQSIVEGSLLYPNSYLEVTLE